MLHHCGARTVPGKAHVLDLWCVDAYQSYSFHENDVSLEKFLASELVCRFITILVAHAIVSLLIAMEHSTLKSIKALSLYGFLQLSPTATAPFSVT